jgi:hypothetical protein
LAINAAAMGRRGTMATGLCRCGDSGDGEIYAVKDNVYNIHLPRLLSLQIFKTQIFSIVTCITMEEMTLY